ncbi:glycosyl transferase, partial [Escherichia coli]
MKQKKTVAIVGTNGLPGRYGGWDQLMNNLTILERDNYDFVVYTSSYNAVEGVKEVNGAKLKIIGLKANGWQSVPYDIISLFHSAMKYDVILVLGTSGCVVLPI